MKKFLQKVLAVCMIVSLFVEPICAAGVPAHAETNTITIQLSDTMTAEITLETYQIRSSSAVQGRKTYELKRGSQTIGRATAIISFAYNGSTAWVTDTDYTYSTVNGCTYSHGGITTSGNRASMSGTFYYGGASYPFSISLTCSGSGTIS